MAISKAANGASIAQEAMKSGPAVTACREDDARSTSASSMQGDGGSDIHTISSDEEQEGALQQSEAVQHKKVLANAPWRREEQQQQWKQKQRNALRCKVEQPSAPPGLQLPASDIGGKAAFAASRKPPFRAPPGLPPPGLPPAGLLPPSLLPPGLPPPPGFMELPPGLLFPDVKPVAAAANDSYEGKPVALQYSPQAFRRELAKIMRELRLHKNPGLAVGQVRICGVPQQHQASEFVDILTRAAEESRGPARRTCMAFVGGLTKAFGKKECIAGLRMFFDEVYPDLSMEVPRLRNIVMTELVPTLKVVLEDGEMSALQPSLFDAVGCYAA